MHRITRPLVAGLLCLGAVLAARPSAAQAPPTDTLSFSPAADSYVESTAPTRNFNTDVQLRADGSPIRIIYLRFTIAGLNGRTVQQARLRLGVSGNSDSGGTIHRISDNSWNEATLTYDTRPPIDGPGLATVGAVVTGALVEFDLGGAISADGTYNFAIDSTSTSSVGYVSAAATSGQKPLLVLTVTSGPAPVVRILQPAEASSFFLGDPVTLQGTALDSVDGDLSPGLAWRSDLQGDLGAGSSRAPTLAQGSHTITASVTDHDGFTGQTMVHVSVGPRPPANTAPLIAITAPLVGRTYTAGAPISFTGTANDLEDGDLTSRLRWTSDRDGSLGTGGGFTKSLTAGTHHLTAAVTDARGATGSADVTVMVEAPIVLEIVPVADAYVDSASTSANYGTRAFLSADANSMRVGYLRFAVTGVARRPVVRAVLRMQVDGTSAAASPSGGALHFITGSTWDERTITHKNKPPVDGPTYASVGAVKANQVVEFDVTGAVTGDGTYNLALTSASTDNADYRSRETSTPPKLVLTLAPNAPVVAITTPPNQDAVFAGTPVLFSGRASDVEDGDLSAGLHWASSLDGMLGDGTSVESSTLRIGTHAITATVSDTAGHGGQAQISLRVRGPNGAPTVTIASPTDGTSLPAGAPLALSAAAADDFDTDLAGKIHWTSSLDGDLGTGPLRTVALRHEGPHTITAAVTDSDGAAGQASVALTVTPSPPAVAITSPAGPTTVFVGSTVVCTASALDATDGDLSALVHWTSSLDRDLGDGASLNVDTLGVGTHVLTASVQDSGGLLGVATRTVVVRPPNVAPTLTIQTPGDGTAILSGRPVVLDAVAGDAEDGDLGARVRWTSSLSGPLGMGGTITVPGLAVGTHTLTATVTDRDEAVASASVSVTVGASTLSFVAAADTYVDSGSPTKGFGTTTAFLAGGRPVRESYLRFQVAGVGIFAVQRAILRLTVGTGSSDGGKVGGTVRAMTGTIWSETSTTYNTRPVVSGPTLASVTTLIKPKGVVDFDVTAGLGSDGTYDFALLNTNSDWVKYQSRESTRKPELILTLKPNTAPAVSIAAPATGTVARRGTAVALTGRATDTESGDLSAQLEWRSDRDGLLGIGRSLTPTTLSPGRHTITARVTDPSGASGEAQTVIVVDTPPVVTIDGPPDHTVAFTTAPVALHGTATDDEDGDLTGGLAWTSSLDGPFGGGDSASSALLHIGTHTITATASDADGVAARAQMTLRVRGPNVAPVVDLTTPASGASVPAGVPVTLAATASDDFDGNLTSQLLWTSDLDGTLFTGGARTLVPAHEGLHTITAMVTDSDGASASASVMVTVTPTPPVVTIVTPVVAALLFENNTLTFSGTAADATDGDLSSQLMWILDDTDVIGTGATVRADLGMGTHTITATVSDAGRLVGSATRTLLVRPPDVPPTLTIEAPTDGAALFAGRPLVLAAHAMDVENGNLGAAIRWASNLDGVLGTGSMLTLTTLSPGAHLITATVADQDGAEASASVSVLVSPMTLAFLPVADTCVDSANASTKFGAATSLSADASPAKETYLRFRVSGIVSPFTVKRVRLRLTAAAAAAAASPAGGEVRSMTAGQWSEATTTYGNRPRVDGLLLAAQGAVKVNQVVDFDITSALTTDGTYDFAVVTTSSDEVIYQSREATTGTPQLLVDLGGPDDPTLSIASPVSGQNVPFGQDVLLSATAADRQDGDLSASIRWTSSLDGPLGTGAMLLRTLSPGTHVIAATVTDSSLSPASATVTVTVAASGSVGFRDFTHPSSVGTQASNEATAQKPESHLWYLDHTWWAALYSPAGRANHIFKLDPVAQRWIDTGVFLDERPLSRQDCLWNGDKLYMASRTGYLASGENRLLRFSYDPGLQTYFLDPGFPVTLPGGGTESMTLAQDTTGRFWVAYTWNSTVYVAHSLADDLHWSAPFVLPATTGLPVDPDDIAGIIAMNGKIGVFWTNQKNQADYFAWHPDASAPAADWRTEVAVAGNSAADDHFNMKFAADGRLWVVMKTSRTGSNDILVGLLVRAPDGTWSPMYSVGTFGGTWGTRGVVELDEVHRRVYVFYSAFHQTIYYKTTDMDSISLPSGLGIPFITSPSVNDINNPTGSKAPVTPESGIVIEASSPGDLSYWHNHLHILP